MISFSIGQQYCKNNDLKVSKSAEEAETAAREFYEYTYNLIDEKIKNPQDDMISRLATVSENDQKLSKHQIILQSFCY